MFIIFGWGHKKITSYGQGATHQCRNCGNTTSWELKKISTYFTLFFLPIFPYKSVKIYHCPVCGQGTELKDNEFINYKEIAEINQDYAQGVIEKREAETKLKEIYERIEEDQNKEKEQLKIESTQWESTVSKKTNEELLKILRESEDYDPSFVMAAQNEIQKRRA